MKQETKTWKPVAVGHYGIVRIMRGAYAGLAYYDDDSWENGNKLILYPLGEEPLVGGYILMNRRHVAEIPEDEQRAAVWQFESAWRKKLK